MERARIVTACALLAVIAGCGSRAERPRPERAPAPRRARPAPDATPVRPNLDAALPAEQPRPLPGVLAACVHRVQAGIPRELAGALDALEYPRIAEDGCRLDLAVATRDPALCDGVALSAVRERCRARTAIATARPEACPPSVLDRGRDPVCVALAARASGLCTAASRHDLLRCLAIARGDERDCASLDPLLRPGCTGDVTALRGVLPRLLRPPLPPATARLRVAWGTRIEPEAGGAPREFTLSAFARGAYLDERGTLYLVDPTRGWPSELATTLGSAEPVVGVAIALPSRPARGGLVALRVVLPEGRVVETGGASERAEVQLTELTRQRGGIVAGTVTAQAFATGIPVAVEVEFRTFVRDVVTAETLGAPAPP